MKIHSLPCHPLLYTCCCCKRPFPPFTVHTFILCYCVFLLGTDRSTFQENQTLVTLHKQRNLISHHPRLLSSGKVPQTRGGVSDFLNTFRQKSGSNYETCQNKDSGHESEARFACCLIGKWIKNDAQQGMGDRGPMVHVCAGLWQAI